MGSGSSHVRPHPLDLPFAVITRFLPQPTPLPSLQFSQLVRDVDTLNHDRERIDTRLWGSGFTAACLYVRTPGGYA